MKKTLKWIGIAFGSLIALIVAAAIIVPLVVDVDKYRPQIVQAANERINGKLELGKLSLSLWGQVRVQVQGVNLTDAGGRKVIAVSDAYFHIPFSSILSGSPAMIFKADKPELNVAKDKAGKLNLLSLMKDQKGQAEAAATGGTPPAGNGSAPAQPTKLPGMAENARLGVELRNALVNYKDEATGLTSQVKDFNLVMKDISLSRTTEIEMWADLDTKMGQTFALKGPMKLKAHAKPELVNGVFNRATIDAKLELDDVDMSSGATFHKAKGVPFNMELAATSSPKEAQLDKFVFKFHNAEIKANGKVTNLGAAPGGTAPSPVVQMTLTSNDIDFGSWNKLVPMLDEYELAGKGKLDASANGPTDKLGYKAKLVINGLTAKAGKLKAQPRFDAVVDVVTDQIQNMQLTMKAPGNEMTFKGSLVSFTKPVGKFELTSPGMDLDQLIDWPPPPSPGAKTAAAPGAGGAPAGGSGAPVADTDASVEPLRSNPVAAAANVSMALNMKMLKAKGIKMTDLVGRLYLKDLTAGLEGFAMKMWDGTVKMNFASQLKPKAPTYTFSVVTDGLQLKQAVADNVAMFKNTIIGKAHFEVNGSGASFNTDPAIANLKAKGNMKIENATFATIDVAKMASEAINGGLAKVAEKLPQAKGKTVNAPGGRETRYEFISSDFTIDGGKFRAPNFQTKAAPGSGIDLKGDTQLGLKDYALAADWLVIDTFDVTGAKKIDVEVAGTQVKHILAEGDGPVKFPVHVGCTAFQPCFKYTEVPEYLAKVAVANSTGAATSRAKAEVAKKIESVVPKSAPPAVQNAVKSLGKKLFR
jgi:uncharacterized protein involved in outer membrane biogenesis